MANIQIDQLGDAIQEELTIYHKELTENINKLSKGAAKKLVKATKPTAPVASGSFASNIASKAVKKSPNGDTYAWYVKKPDHRITHLIVHGHATPDGGRVPGNPFLENALGPILTEYERDVQEAIRNG